MQTLGTSKSHMQGHLSTSLIDPSTSSTDLNKHAILHDISSLCIFLGRRKNERWFMVTPVEHHDCVQEIAWKLDSMAQSSSNTMCYRWPRSFFSFWFYKRPRTGLFEAHPQKRFWNDCSLEYLGKVSFTNGPCASISHCNIYASYTDDSKSKL